MRPPDTAAVILMPIVTAGFDGPMDGHGPGQPRHYDKHAWLWAHNPAGTWASWNPALSCPTGG